MSALLMLLLVIQRLVDRHLCQLAVSDCLSSTAAKARRGSMSAGCIESLYLACTRHKTES